MQLTRVGGHPVKVRVAFRAKMIMRDKGGYIWIKAQSTEEAMISDGQSTTEVRHVKKKDEAMQW